jgi:hypothetical protein
VVVDRGQVELWSNDLSASTSSPILVGDRVYVVTEKGYLCSVDAVNGKVLWRLSLGIEQRNSCPLSADGKLYVPILEARNAKSDGGEAGSKGAFFVIQPTDQEGRILSQTTLDGRCFGSPAAYDGKLYVQTTQRLYCFGKAASNPQPAAELANASGADTWPKPGKAAQLQIVPSEVLLNPGEAAGVRVRTLDANGFLVEEIKDLKSVKWAPYIPPTARVRATMKASFDDKGRLVAGPDRTPSAGAFQATLGSMHGYMRGRVLPGLPLKEDFQSFALTEKPTNAPNGELFAYPPLPWIGARFKFEVREKDGNKALTKTIDNKLFQRAFVFLGEADMAGYTIQADVMSEGNNRKMSDVGVINQRYAIVLKGNEKKLEVNSNLERLRVATNFKWSPNVWYRLKARVDLAADGSGVVRAKAWKRDDPEPEKWTLEVPHRTAHQTGCPGLFGFSPQEMLAYIDNIEVTKNP